MGTGRVVGTWKGGRYTMAMKLIARLLMALLLVLPMACASSEIDGTDTDQSPRARYGGSIGESPVGVIPEARLVDQPRNREIVLNVEYPTRPGPHPMILFSHGFGSTHRDYIGLSSYWASQGYVVIKPRHADGGRAGERPLLPEIVDQSPADWQGRVRDLSYVLDSLDALEQKYPELGGKIDREKIGVAGHQYGAHTAALIAGARTFPGGTTYKDPRVKAVVLMAPQGPDTLGLTGDSWSALNVPALFMAGSADAGPTGSQTVEWRRRAFDSAAAGDKWLMIIDGAGDSSFTGRIDRTAAATVETADPLRRTDPNDPYQPRQTQTRRRDTNVVIRDRNAFGTIRTMSLAFWDAYLRGEAEGRTALQNAGSRSGVLLESR